MLGSTPTFTNPPIVEVVLGVEFTPIDGLKTIHYQDIYDLFRENFPIFQDTQPLATSLDNIEGDPLNQISPQADANPTLPRLWCLSHEEDLQIQFQADRFVLNWRKRGEQNVYPSFEKLAPMFKREFSRLKNHVRDEFEVDLNMSQIEVSYVNLINNKDFSKLYKFQKILMTRILI